MPTTLDEAARHDRALRINEHFEQAQDHYAQAAQHAVEAGRLLAEVKGSLPYGQWSDWLDLFCGPKLSLRTAQSWIKLARDHDKLPFAEAKHVSSLPSIRQAQAAILTLLPPPKTRTSRIGAGPVPFRTPVLEALDRIGAVVRECRSRADRGKPLNLPDVIDRIEAALSVLQGPTTADSGWRRRDLEELR